MSITSHRFPSLARLAAPSIRWMAAASLAIACLAPSAHAQKKAKVFGFYPDFDLTPELTNAQLDLLTHVVYFSIQMPADGNVTDTYVNTKGQGINGQRLIDVLYRAKDRGVKLLLGVGGADRSDNIGTVIGNANLRQQFAASATNFCTTNGLAGIDLDWESPYAPPDGQQGNLASFLKTVSAAFKPKGLIVTISVNGGAPQNYGADAMNAADDILIMAYDNGNPSYDQAVAMVGSYASQVSVKSKLVLGVPFYGRSGGATMTYADMIKANPGLGAGTNSYNGYNFNGPDLMAQKSGFIVDQGGGGTMIWQVSQDAMTSAAPGGILLSAISKGIIAKGATLDKPAVSILARPFALDASDASDRFSLRRQAGSFSMTAGSLVPGAYRLTMMDASGRTMAQSLALLPSPDGSDRVLNWSGISAEAGSQGALLYRVDKDSRTITSGAVPGNSGVSSRNRALDH